MRSFLPQNLLARLISIIGSKSHEKAADKLENLIGCAREIDKDLHTEDGAALFTVEVRNYHVPAHKNKWLS